MTSIFTVLCLFHVRDNFTKLCSRICFYSGQRSLLLYNILRYQTHVNIWSLIQIFSDENFSTICFFGFVLLSVFICIKKKVWLLIPQKCLNIMFFACRILVIETYTISNFVGNWIKLQIVAHVCISHTSETLWHHYFRVANPMLPITLRITNPDLSNRKWKILYYEHLYFFTLCMVSVLSLTYISPWCGIPLWFFIFHSYVYFLVLPVFKYVNFAILLHC